MLSKEIARRVKEKRLILELTQKAMSKRTLIPLATYRYFERTGKISLTNLIRIAEVLDSTKDFDNLFSGQIYKSIDDVIKTKKILKRGTIGR